MEMILAPDGLEIAVHAFLRVEMWIWFDLISLDIEEEEEEESLDKKSK